VFVVGAEAAAVFPDWMMMIVFVELGRAV